MGGGRREGVRRELEGDRSRHVRGRVPLLLTLAASFCNASAVLLRCFCGACAVLLQCICGASAVLLSDNGDKGPELCHPHGGQSAGEKTSASNVLSLRVSKQKLVLKLVLNWF